MEARKTEYKGIVFKSKSEAQLAYIFDLWREDNKNISIESNEYEPIKFKTSSGYIPDFIRTQVYKDSVFPIYIKIVEYKPVKPNKTYIEYLSNQFAEILNKDGYRFIDAYLLYFGSVYHENISCMMFDINTKKLDVDYFHVDWITKEYYDKAKLYRFDL